MSPTIGYGAHRSSQFSFPSNTDFEISNFDHDADKVPSRKCRDYSARDRKMAGDNKVVRFTMDVECNIRVDVRSQWSEQEA